MKIKGIIAVIVRRNRNNVIDIRRKRGRKNFSSYILETGSLQELIATKQRTKALTKYAWNEHSELARQRSLAANEIKQALIQTCHEYRFNNWQRGVKYKYGLQPLSTVGSLTYLGGRFNTGNAVNTEIPVFPALYIASNKDTALQEHLGQSMSSVSDLTAREFALINPASETIVSISGKLDKVFDLTNLDNLIPFVDIVKSFEFSKALKTEARHLGFREPSVIKTPMQLLEHLQLNDWRRIPGLFEIPAPSQIFGHLIQAAEIEGIYPKHLKLREFRKKSCNGNKFMIKWGDEKISNTSRATSINQAA